MIQKLSSGLNKLKKYGGAIKEILRPSYHQEKTIETDNSEYRFPRTLDEAAAVLKELKIEDKKSNPPKISPVNNFKPLYFRRESKVDRIVEGAGVIGEGIPKEDLGKVSSGQNDPISVWRSIRDAEEN
jgi:hypothetical protein